MSGATFRTGDVVRTTYSSSPRDERLVVTGYIETGEVDVYPEGGDPVGQSLLFPPDRLELLDRAEFRTGDRVRTTYRATPRGQVLVVTEHFDSGPYAGKVDAYPDRPECDPVGWSMLYPADRLEPVDDGVIRSVPWPVDTGAPRPDSAAHRSFSLAGLASVRRAPMFGVGEDA